MKRRIYLSILSAIALLFSLQSCVNEEFPSTVPSKPTKPGIPEGTVVESCSVELSISGADVEDDLEIKYEYYISTDNKTFEKVDSRRVRLKPETQYWWYAKSYTDFSQGEESDVFSFYCRPPQYKLKNIVDEYSQGIEFEFDSALVYFEDTVTVKFKLSDGYKLYDVRNYRIVDGDTQYFGYFELSDDSTSYKCVVKEGETRIKFYVKPQFCSLNVSTYVDYETIPYPEYSKRYNVGDTIVIGIPEQYKNDYTINSIYNCYPCLEVTEKTEQYVKAAVVRNGFASPQLNLRATFFDLYASVVIGNDTTALPDYPKRYNIDDDVDVSITLPKQYADNYYIYYVDGGRGLSYTSYTDDTYSGSVSGTGVSKVYFVLEKKIVEIKIYVDDVLDTTIVNNTAALYTQYEVDLSKYVEKSCKWSSLKRTSGVEYAEIKDYTTLEYSLKNTHNASIELRYKSVPEPRQTDTGKSLVNRYFGNENYCFEFVPTKGGGFSLVFYSLWSGEPYDYSSYSMERYDGFANFFKKNGYVYEVYLSKEEDGTFKLQVTEVVDQNTSYYYGKEFSSHDEMISNLSE